LIKDYDLEVHYHPGKANVVADALNRKTQCNCITIDSKIAALCDELHKLNMEVVSPGTLGYILVEPTLQEQIIMAQISKKGIQVIKEMLNQKVDKYKCFRQDSKGVLWLKTGWLSPRIQNSGTKSWTKLIFPSFPCTLEVTRCIMTSDPYIGVPG
jgi:hypothetical protein